MNTEHLSRGWALIAEGAQYISLAYASNDPPLARSGVPASLPAADPEAGAPLPVSGPSFDDLPPEGYEDPRSREQQKIDGDRSTFPPLNPQVEAGLGKCPVHGKPWSVKAAGVSKAGAPYEAFYKCDSKDGDEFCKQKPQKIWRDLHPIPGASAAA